MSNKSVGNRLISAVFASSFLLMGAPSHAQIFKDDCSELLGGNCAADEPAKKPPAPKKRVVTEIEAPEVEPEKPRAVESAKPVQLAKTVLPPPEKITPWSELVVQRVPEKPVRSISASGPPNESVAEKTVEDPAPVQPKPAAKPPPKPPQTQAPIRFAAKTPRNEPKIERRIFSPSARPPEPVQTASLNKRVLSPRKPIDIQPAQPTRIEIRLAPLMVSSTVPVDAAFRAMEQQAERACSGVLAGLPKIHPEWQKCIGAEVEYRVYHSGDPKIVDFFESLLTFR